MPRKSKQPEKAHLGKFNQVWESVPIDDWLAWLVEERPESRFHRHGPHIKGCCPMDDHDDPKPSFCVSPSKGLVKCFGCSRAWSNPVRFVAMIRKCSFSEAVLFLRKRFGLKALIPEALHEKLQAFEAHQDRKYEFASFFCSLFYEAVHQYPDIDPALVWARDTVEFLMRRNLGGYAPGEPRPVDDVDGPRPADPASVWMRITMNQLVGVFPPLAYVLNKFGESSEECRFYRTYFNEFNNDSKFVGALVFVLHAGPSSVGSFKLRVVPEPAQKVTFFVPDPFEAELGGFRGYFGLHYYRMFLGSDENGAQIADTAHMVEGEFDALSSIARQIRGQSDDFIILSGSGASIQTADHLRQFGITKVNVLQDDDAGGNEFVHNLVERTSSRISFKVFNWPDEYRGYRDPAAADRRIKDPDDAVRWLGYSKWRRYVGMQDAYLHAYEWVFDRASEEIGRVPQDDVKRRYRIAMEWGKLLKDNAELSSFCGFVAQHYQLDKTLLFRDVRAKDEDEESFIDRCADVLRDFFHFVGVQHAESRKRLLLFFDKKKRAMDNVVLSDARAVESALAPYFGPLYLFVREQIGEPAFLAPEGEDGAVLPIELREKRYAAYLKNAFEKIAKDLPSLDHAPVRAQGLHLISARDGTLRSYLVNGKDVYEIVHEGGKMAVTMLDGPSHNGTVFNTEGEAWLSSVKGPGDLSTGMDLPTAFATVRDIVETGWAFSHPRLDCTFLAAYLMCLGVMTVFTRQTAIIVNAEAASGKSKLVSGLISGVGFPRIRIVAHAVGMHGYTAASIRQQRNNSSLCVCLEEFEDDGSNNKKAVAVRNVLEMTRDLISESAVAWSIGTTTGESRTYHLRFPMVCCSIRPLRDAASLSRFIGFELVKEDNRVDPVTAVVDKFGDEKIAEVRHALAVGLLPYMPRLRELQAEVEKEYASGSVLPSHVPSRFREAMFPVLAMLKLLREEAARLGSPVEVPAHQHFAFDFAESRKESLLRLRTTAENEQIFEMILSSAIQVARAGGEHHLAGTTTIRGMLGDLNALGEINKTNVGVYFDDRNEWLVVNWIEASQGVLANTRFKNDGSAYLKQVAERSPYFVKQEIARQERVLDRLVDVMGPGHTWEHVTVFSVKHLLAEVRAHQDKTRQAPSVEPPRAPERGQVFQNDIEV